MDKHTLGNYGWIIVTTIIIIILIMLASPAGAYFGRAFTSIADEFSEQVVEGTDGAIIIETPPLSTDELQKKYSKYISKKCCASSKTSKKTYIIII